MDTKHIFNEDRQRLEPLDKTCGFCGVNQNKDADDNLYIPLFREGKRTNIIVYSSVRFQKLMIGIPRCSSCAIIHGSTSATGYILSWSLGILMAVILGISMGAIALAIGAFMGIFMGIWGGQLIAAKLCRNKHIHSKQEGAELDETIQSLLKEGWSFNQPSA